MLTPNVIDCGECSLHPVQPTNVWVVEELFRCPDVRHFFVLRQDHAANINTFCQFLINENVQRTGLSFIIYDCSGSEVGLITAEVVKNHSTNMPAWNIGYAVLPRERRKGYAALALNGLTDFLLQNFSIPQVMLDISTENTASEGVARHCGFTKPDDYTGYIDIENMDVGMRFRWYRQLAGQRTMLFNKAVQYYRSKAYAEAVLTFKQALKEPYTPGTPYTDAQIYSNMGMALSSLHMYHDAFDALKKAQVLGLSNLSIEKELNWLREHQGIF